MNDEGVHPNVLAAIVLSASSIRASLISHLKTIGILSDQDVREIYERALLLLETADSSAGSSKLIFAEARQLIEEHLRPD